MCFKNWGEHFLLFLKIWYAIIEEMILEGDDANE